MPHNSKVVPLKGSATVQHRSYDDSDFRHLAEAMPQIVWVANAEGVLEYFNSRWYEYTGRSTDNSLGNTSWSEAFHPDDQEVMWQRWLVSLRTGKPYEIEYRCRSHKGEWRWFLGRSLPVRDTNGKIMRWFGTCTDIHDKITTEHRMKQAMEQAEAASMAKSEFLANMSHEIRTPMNAVVGLANILSASAPLTEKQREYISTLQLSAEQLLQLINDLLDMSRLESNGIHLEAIPFDLDALVRDVLTINTVKAREKHITLEHRGECRQQLIGDPLRMKQSIMNLVSNAVKFTDEGSVSVNVFATPRANAMVDVMIAVEDTGVGISPEQVETIFGKFTQADSAVARQYGGSGLGLSITKTLVELMGGQISVNSQPGKGSCFTITLSLPTVAVQEAPVKTAAAKPKVAEPAIGGNTPFKVLLVEDYEANVLVATMLLQSFGINYDLASTGEQALQKIAANQYGMVLMDVQMPGMNGYQATAIIREREAGTGQRLPIVGMTAHALKGDRERCVEAGMDDYIAKPFRPETLKAAISKYQKIAEKQAD